MKDRRTSVHHGSHGSTLPTVSGAIALGLALLGGCDETSLWRAGDGGHDGKAAAPVVAPPSAPLRVAIAAYDQCYGGCFTAHTNATNRETCKLECDSLAEDGMGALADPGARGAYEHLRGCLLDCWDSAALSETNRSTCRLTCMDSAEVLGTPKPAHELTPGAPIPNASR